MLHSSLYDQLNHLDLCYSVRLLVPWCQFKMTNDDTYLLGCHLQISKNFSPVLVLPLVLYICVGFWLLVHESRDLSQAETKIIVVTSWVEIFVSLEMVRFEKSNCTQNDEKKSSFCVKIVDIVWICAAFLTRVIFDSAWDKSHDSWTNSQKLTHKWGTLLCI